MEDPEESGPSIIIDLQRKRGLIQKRQCSHRSDERNTSCSYSFYQKVISIFYEGYSKSLVLKMAKLLNTFWAFLLHVLGISVFQTCFSNAMEDWDGNSLLSGPPLTTFLFASAIYIIILKSNLFPNTFRRPPVVLLSLYEFLATTFLLEFSLACIWTPIDVIIMITLPKKMCQVMHKFGYVKLAEMINTRNTFVDLLCLFTALTFFYLSLHVTRTLDFSILKKHGLACFVSHVFNVIWNRITKEVPLIKKIEKGQISTKRRRRKSKSRESTTSFTDCY